MARAEAEQARADLLRAQAEEALAMAEVYLANAEHTRAHTAADEARWAEQLRLLIAQNDKAIADLEMELAEAQVRHQQEMYDLLWALEEAGAVSDDWIFYKKFDIGWAIQWDTHFFIARNVRKVQEQNLDPGEKIDILELSFEEFLDMGENPLFRNRELSNVLLKAKLHPEQADELKKLLFP